MNVNKRRLNLILAPVAIALGAYNIYSALGGSDLSGSHIDKIKLGFSIILVAVALVWLFKTKKKENKK